MKKQGIASLSERMILLLDVGDSIILDDMDTWPGSIVSLLTSEEVGIRSYLLDESRLDRLAQDDMLLPINRPTNPHRSIWDNAIDRMQQLLEGQSIIAFHCTRLTDEEIEDVRANGLRPLSRSFTQQRIDRLAEQGLIAPAAARTLSKDNQSSSPNREGRIAFFLCLATLADESAVVRLLRCWGGEALYWGHERDPSLCDELRKVGTACVVVAALDPCDIAAIPTLEQRMIRIWLERGRCNPGRDDIDVFLTGRIVPIIDVIPRHDSRFEHLTGCCHWEKSID